MDQAKARSDASAFSSANPTNNQQIALRVPGAIRAPGTRQDDRVDRVKTGERSLERRLQYPGKRGRDQLGGNSQPEQHPGTRPTGELQHLIIVAAEREKPGQQWWH